MYSQDTVVELVSKEKDDWWTLPVNEWAREQRGKTLCRECFHLKPEVYHTPLDVHVSQFPKGTSYDGVFRAGVAMIRRDLLEFLRPHMRDYVLGHCLWKDGSVLQEYASIHFTRRVQCRGDRDAVYFLCKECGFIGCISENPYVLRYELADQDVFATKTDCLFLSESLASAFPWKQFRDLEPWTYPVRDEPLPDDPLYLLEHDPDKVLYQKLRGNACDLRYAKPKWSD